MLILLKNQGKVRYRTFQLRLMQRADDNEDSLKKRLQQYHDQTIPILKHYQAAEGCTITFANANQSIDEVWAQILLGLQ